MSGAWLRLARLLSTAAMLAPAAAVTWAAPAGARPVMLTCTNPTSGAHWTVAIDFARKTADSWPATITARRISWHNRKDQGFYSLDRASGELAIIRASSTGGYELHANCRGG